MTLLKAVTFLAAGIGSVVAPCGAAHAQYYAGKTVTIVVGSGPGGCMDTNARQVAAHIGKYIAGKPQIVVRNMPGGSGAFGANYVYEVAKPDGLTLFYGQWLPVAQLLGRPELRADYGRMEIVGAASEVRGVIMRSKTPPGIKVPADLAKANGFSVGGTSINGTPDILNRMSLDLLGANYKLISGYGSGSETRLAMRRSEIDFLNNSIASLLRTFGDDIATGEVIPVYYFCTINDSGAIVRHERIKDMPCFVDLYRELKGTLPTGKLWNTLNFYTALNNDVLHIFAAPPATPKHVTEELAAAYYKAVEDPEFTDFYIKTTGSGPEIASLETVQKVLASLASVRPDVIEQLREYYGAN